MKKALIIAYYYNDNSIIGAVRSRAIVKRLPDHGWMPVVLTSGEPCKGDDENKIYRIHADQVSSKWKRLLSIGNETTFKEAKDYPSTKGGNSKIDHLLSIWEDLFVYPDEAGTWIDVAYQLAEKIVETEKIDLVFSTSYPVSSHVIASRLKKRFGIPWIADFRDLWTQNPYYNRIMVRKMVEKKLEVRTIARADALTTISDQLAYDLTSLHGKTTLVIPNGFDPQEVNSVGEELSSKFEIVYTGVLYQGKRDPTKLLNVLNKLIVEGKINRQDVLVQFYGEYQHWLKDLVNDLEMNDVVKINGRIPREDALKVQRRAQLLLLLTWDDPKENGVLTGKLFDYMAAKRPVISIGNCTGALPDLLMRTGIGECVNNEIAIEKKLLKYYIEYKNDGKVHYNGIDSMIYQYSHVEMVDKFAILFDSTSKKQAIPGRGS